MEFTNVGFKEPKDKRGALHLVASATGSKTALRRKIETMKNHIEEVKQKMSKLESELQKLNANIHECEIREELSDQIIQTYSNQYNLIETEILDLRLQLLRKGLKSTEAQLREGEILLGTKVTKNT